MEMELVKMISEVITFWVLSYFTSGIVHEGGHVIAGLAQGWKFELLVVGPFKLYRAEDDRVKLGLEKNLVYWCGVGGTIPRGKSEDNIKKFAVILLAGPLASVLFGGICGISLFYGLTIFRAMMTFVPLSMGIACLLPNAKTGILYTDGGRFLRIMKGGKTAAEERAVFDAAMLERLEPGNKYDETGIEAMTTSKDLEFQYLGHYYAYLNAKKTNNVQEMKERMIRMEALRHKVPAAIIDMCALEG